MNGLVAKAATNASRFFFKAKKALIAKSPEILIVTGTVAIVGGVVLACKETLHLEEVLDNHNQVMDALERTRVNAPDTYTDEDVRHDKIVLTTRTAMELVKLYAPAATTIIFGIGCTIGAYGIMKKRNVALMAAYKALEAQFMQYRQRVIADAGKDADEQYMTGLSRAGEDVEGTPIKRGDLVVTNFDASMYARFFDRANPHYTTDLDSNLYFIQAQENTADRLLRKRGVLLLNDVYDLLGIDRTDAGAQVGWELHGDKDNTVDFKIMHVWRDIKTGNLQQNFTEGYERVILIDFNVDGIVSDKFDTYGAAKKRLVATAY